MQEIWMAVQTVFVYVFVALCICAVGLCILTSVIFFHKVWQHINEPQTIITITGIPEGKTNIHWEGGKETLKVNEKT